MSGSLFKRGLLATLMGLVMGAALLGFARPASAAGEDGFFVNAINSIRVGRGLAPLAVDGQLNSVATAWSQNMATTGTLQHNPALSSQVTGWRTLGENVGTGSALASIEGAFENSPHHFENMVDPSYTSIGVGVVRDGNGTYWVTEEFKQATNAPKVAAPARPAAPVAPKAAPKAAPRSVPKPASTPRPAATSTAARPAAKPAPAPVRPASPAPVATTPAPTVPLAVLGSTTEQAPTPVASSSPVRNPFTGANVAGLMALVVLGASMALFARVRRTRGALAA